MIIEKPYANAHTNSGFKYWFTHAIKEGGYFGINLSLLFEGLINKSYVAYPWTPISGQNGREFDGNSSRLYLAEV